MHPVDRHYGTHTLSKFGVQLLKTEPTPWMRPGRTGWRKEEPPAVVTVRQQLTVRMVQILNLRLIDPDRLGLDRDRDGSINDSKRNGIVHHDMPWPFYSSQSTAFFSSKEKKKSKHGEPLVSWTSKAQAVGPETRATASFLAAGIPVRDDDASKSPYSASPHPHRTAPPNHTHGCRTCLLESTRSPLTSRAAS